MARAFVSVGSNIEPERNVRDALHRLAGRIKIVAISTFYRSEPVGPPGQPFFFNGVVEIRTELSPLDVKYGLLRPIEAELGRVRTEDKYEPRPIDLDLIVYEGQIAASPGLTLPDPELLSRPFLAIPLSELAPDLVLPGQVVSLSEIASQFTDHGMEALTSYSGNLREVLSNES